MREEGIGMDFLDCKFRWQRGLYTWTLTHLPERCSNSVPPVRTDNYRNAVPAPKCLPERRSGAFRHHYTTGTDTERPHRCYHLPNNRLTSDILHTVLHYGPEDVPKIAPSLGDGILVPPTEWFLWPTQVQNGTSIGFICFWMAYGCDNIQGGRPNQTHRPRVARA